jgi:N-acetylneuraminate synthase
MSTRAHEARVFPEEGEARDRRFHKNDRPHAALSAYVIAEAGVNHNGDVEQALGLVDAAARAGADAVKFQTFRTEALVTDGVATAAYQEGATGIQTQRELLGRLELSEEDFRRLQDHCGDRGIAFLSTPFDTDSADFLIDSLDISVLKIGSGDLTNAPLLLRVARSGKSVILSTGMSWLGEVEEALGVLAFGYTRADAPPSRDGFRTALASPEGRQALLDRVTLLHCTTQYPADPEDVHLRAMDTLRSAFGLPVGYSDHTRGLAVPIAAVARGARVIEKHLTLDRTQDGPDHRASLEPDEFANMVRAIRSAEAALGQRVKQPAPSEWENRSVARRHLVAAQDLPAGHRLSALDIAVKRSPAGASPMEFWAYQGRVTPAPLRSGEPLDFLSGS